MSRLPRQATSASIDLTGAVTPLLRPLPGELLPVVSPTPPSGTRAA